jgi:hypothetical protein
MPAAWRDRPYGRFRPVPEAVPRQRAGRLTTQRSTEAFGRRRRAACRSNQPGQSRQRLRLLDQGTRSLAVFVAAEGGESGVQGYAVLRAHANGSLSPVATQ